MNMTNDQYVGLNKLEKWYRKYEHQIIEISGVIGTGTWDLVQKFIDIEGFDSREIMYLSYDQKQVLELASKRYHAYYINGVLYNYEREVNFDSLPVVNPSASGILDYSWKKKLKKKIDPRYKLIIVFDSILLSQQTLLDISSFGLPIILIRDPMLLPSPDTYTFLRDANIELNEIQELYLRNPIVYFAHKILHDDKLTYGNYDSVSIVPRKQMNLYNLKSSDMNITISDELRYQVNKIYRERILNRKDSINIINEKIIIMNDMYGEKLVNKDEKNIKVYLRKGLIGRISKINHHVASTKYVPIDLKPEFYFDTFFDLVLDRFYLNKIEANSRQLIPDEILQAEYAYALTPSLARLSHWDKVTLIIDPNYENDSELQKRLLYTSITRSKKALTIIT